MCADRSSLGCAVLRPWLELVDGEIKACVQPSEQVPAPEGDHAEERDGGWVCAMHRPWDQTYDSDHPRANFPEKEIQSRWISAAPRGGDLVVCNARRRPSPAPVDPS